MFTTTGWIRFVRCVGMDVQNSCYLVFVIRHLCCTESKGNVNRYGRHVILCYRYAYANTRSCTSFLFYNLGDALPPPVEHSIPIPLTSSKSIK